MAVPDFQSFFRPMLETLADGAPRPLAAMREHLRVAMAVSDADFQEMLPSGVRTRFSDRVYWANTHLYQAGLIERPSSGVLAITDRGRAFLAKHQGKILVSDLMQFPEFAAFRKKSSTPPPDPKAAPANEKTPQERIEEAYAELQATLAKELLDRVAASSPTAFEAHRRLWRWWSRRCDQSGCLGPRPCLHSSKAMEGVRGRRSNLRLCRKPRGEEGNKGCDPHDIVLH